MHSKMRMVIIRKRKKMLIGKKKSGIQRVLASLKKRECLVLILVIGSGVGTNTDKGGGLIREEEEG
jgi:hypothetical protein